MKKLTLFILVLLTSYAVQAQLHGNKWRIGLSMGTTNYVGDIRPIPLNSFENFTKLYKHYDHYSERFSYQFSLEHALGNSVGLMLTAGTYQFGSGDRFVQNDGTLLRNSPNFDRALNFQTDLYDAGLSLVFKPDNNWLLSGKSFFAPYLTLGFGLQTFDVKGDLLNANGNRYDYSNPNTIPDGTFETNLSNLGTENPEGYSQTTLYANLGLGVRFRITKSIEIFAQSDFKRAATDYLDDVAGDYRMNYANSFQEYAAKPGTNVVNSRNRNRGFSDGRGDWYIYHGIGLKFSFGASKKAFRPPVISQRHTYVPSELPQKQLPEEEIESDQPVPTGKVTNNNYFNIIQFPSTKKKEVPVLDSVQRAQNEAKIDSLQSVQENLSANLDSTNNELEELDKILELTQKDTAVSDSIQNIRKQNIQSQKEKIQKNISEIDSLQARNNSKIDSLKTVAELKKLVETSIDTTALIQEFMFFPEEMKLSASQPTMRTESKADTVIQLSPAPNRVTPSATTGGEMVSRSELNYELERLKNQMLQSQSKRDSALLMALANREMVVEDRKTEVVRTEADPQEITITQESVDNELIERAIKNQEEANKALERAMRQAERRQKRSERLLRDAVVAGGAAATTSAIKDNRQSNQQEVDTVATPSAQNSENQADTTALPDQALNPKLEPVLAPTKTEVDTVFVEKETKVLLTPQKIEIYFDINQKTLAESEIEKLEPLKKILQENPSVSLELVGFADNTGSVAYNLKLTRERVEAVKKVLTETYDIPASKISTEEGGMIVRGRSSGSQASDRKVEIRLIQKGN